MGRRPVRRTGWPVVAASMVVTGIAEMSIAPAGAAGAPTVTEVAPTSGVVSGGTGGPMIGRGSTGTTSVWFGSQVLFAPAQQSDLQQVKTHRVIPRWLMVVAGISVIINLTILGGYLNRRFRR